MSKRETKIDGSVKRETSLFILETVFFQTCFIVARAPSLFSRFFGLALNLVFFFFPLLILLSGSTITQEEEEGAGCQKCMEQESICLMFPFLRSFEHCSASEIWSRGWLFLFEL